MAFNPISDPDLYQLDGAMQMLKEAHKAANQAGDVKFTALIDANRVINTGLNSYKDQFRLAVVLNSMVDEIQAKFLESCENDSLNASTVVTKHIIASRKAGE